MHKMIVLVNIIWINFTIVVAMNDIKQHHNEKRKISFKNSLNPKRI